MIGQRILIEGIGGVSGVVGGKLVQADNKPLLATNDSTITEVINKDGIRVTTLEESSQRWLRF